MNPPTDRRRWFEALLVVMPVLLVLSALQPRAVERTNGCLWDSDTLRTEASGLPGVGEIITGRFDRFPPEYYEHRLARVTAKINALEGTFADYDDAAVACDRLGRGDEAIEWMAGKLAYIETREAAIDSQPPPDLSDERYKYLANLGTFHVHRWLRGGADRADMADVELAREHIAAAIELNPEAHFGRERYQLMAIEWLLDPPEWAGVGSTIFDATPSIAANGPGAWLPRSRLEELGFADAAEGLMGLVALGDGWESVDIFVSLGAVMDDRGDASVAYIARLRARELVVGGALSLHPEALVGYPPEALDRGHIRNKIEVESWFNSARSEAEAWRAARNQYIGGKLGDGEHPDTHAGFWDDWRSPSRAPSLPNGVLGLRGKNLAIAAVIAMVGFLALINVCPRLRWVLARRNTLRAELASRG